MKCVIITITWFFLKDIQCMFIVFENTHNVSLFKHSACNFWISFHVKFYIVSFEKSLTSSKFGDEQYYFFFSLRVFRHNFFCKFATA